MKCKLDGCDNQISSGCGSGKGYCRLHYNRIRKSGNPGPPGFIVDDFICKKCGQKSNKSPGRKICISCRRIQKSEETKIRYAKPGVRDRIRAQVREKAQKPSYRFNHAKNDAKRREIEWQLTLEEFISFCNQSCIYCNNELGKMVKTGSGLDRIDNSVGYRVNNVQSCCYICNGLRSDRLTVEETKVAVLAILEYRKMKA